MKVKVLSRNPADYIRETKFDIFKVPRNYDPDLHPFQECREYVRALNATKLSKAFAKPLLASLDGHRDGVGCLAKHPRRLSLVISGGYDGQVRLWDLPGRRCLAAVQAHNGHVRGISVDPKDGGVYVTVGDDEQVKRWAVPVDDFSDDVEPLSTAVTKTPLRDVTHSWTQPQFATCGEGVDLWDHHRLSPIRSYKWGVDTITKIKFNPIETDLLVSTCADRGVLLYDCRGQAALKKVTLKLRSNSVCWNPMEAYIFTVANEDYNLYTFDMRNLGAPVNCHMDHTSAVMDVDYAPTGREFVSGAYDKSLRVFPCHTGRSREVYHTKRMQRVMTVLWTMDEKYLLSGSDEMNIRIWKAHASEKLGVLRPREERAVRYNEKLKEKFANHPEIRRIARHRKVPKHILSAQREHRTIIESRKRKEANRRQHSKPGAVPYTAERQTHVLKQDD